MTRSPNGLATGWEWKSPAGTHRSGVAHRGKIVRLGLQQYRPPNCRNHVCHDVIALGVPQCGQNDLRYPFLQLNCKRITASSRLRTSRSGIPCRLGFKLEGVHPDVFTSGAAETYGLLLKDAGHWVAEGIT